MSAYEMPGGDNFSMEEARGHAVLIAPSEHVHGIQTKHTKRNNDPKGKDVIVADVVDLVTGEQFYGTMIFASKYIGRLKRSLGKLVIGVVARDAGEIGTTGKNSDGDNVAWILANPTDADKALADKFLADNPTWFTPGASAPAAAPSPEAHKDNVNEAPSDDPWAA